MPDKLDKRSAAEADYRAGMKYKDIASKYDIPFNTIKSWRARYGWTRGAPLSEKDAPKNAKRVHPKMVPRAISESSETDKRKLFAMLYLQSFNATQAYMAAYGVNAESARRSGQRLLTNVDVSRLIDALKDEYLARVDVTTKAAIAQYAKQAMADIGDYLEFGTKTVVVRDGWYSPVKDKLTGKYLTQEVTYIHPKESADVDTSLIKSVHKGKDGFVLELYDKQKALDAILKHVSAEHKDDDNLSIVIDIPKPPVEKGDAPYDDSEN